MKLVHSETPYALLESNSKCSEWIVENPETFSSYIQEIMQQCRGEDGRFVLSQGEKELDIAKNVEVIFDIFSVDCNDRRILSKLYAQLEQLAYGEMFYVRTRELAQRLQAYVMDLEQETDHILNMEQMLDLPAILKALGVKFESLEDVFFERMIRYMKLMSSILNKKLFILINARSFISDAQMQMLIDELKYQDFKILFVESFARDCIPSVQRCIIDKDNCVI